MTTARRPRSDSEDVARDALLKAAIGELSAPRHVRLRPGDLPFWTGIIRSRAMDEWAESDLVVAAQLARCQADIEHESEVLERETTTLSNKRGTPVMNPRVTVVEALCRRELALMRTLKIGGHLTGDARDWAGRRAAEREAAKLLNEQEDEDGDELLARPGR